MQPWSAASSLPIWSPSLACPLNSLSSLFVGTVNPLVVAVQSHRALWSYAGNWHSDCHSGQISVCCLLAESWGWRTLCSHTVSIPQSTLSFREGRVIFLCVIKFLQAPKEQFQLLTRPILSLLSPSLFLASHSSLLCHWLWMLYGNPSSKICCLIWWNEKLSSTKKYGMVNNDLAGVVRSQSLET